MGATKQLMSVKDINEKTFLEDLRQQEQQHKEKLLSAVSVYAIPGIVRSIQKMKENNIVFAVTSICDVTLADISSVKRQRPICEARHLMFFFMAKYTTKSLSQIGRMFNRDHATVIHGKRSVVELCMTDKRFRHKADTIDNLIKSSIVDNVDMGDETVGSEFFNLSNNSK